MSCNKSNIGFGGKGYTPILVDNDMPLGVVNEQEFEQELGPAPAKAEVIDINRGRGETPAKPESLQKIIGEESVNGTPAKTLKEFFQVSQSSISAYKNGSTSTATYNEPKPALAKHINHVKERITRKASKKLIGALDSIDEQDFAGATLRDKAGIAKDLSAIIKNMRDDSPVAAAQTNVQFVIHAPKLRDESEFEVIEAQE